MLPGLATCFRTFGTGRDHLCLNVENYLDSDGDGVGDFDGLTSKLDYLCGLGVTCVWLQPFFPSPNLDNGYDVSE